MTDCARCVTLTRELREAREELAAWSDLRKGKRSVADNFPDRAAKRRETLNRVGPLMRTFNLSPQEASIADCLMSNPDEVIEGPELFRVMGCSPDADPKIVQVVICRVRKGLPKGAINTVWGIGYSMSEKHAEDIKAKMESEK